ncbi:hypothetical protein A9266_19000 [Vibrio tasmaniensis]|nr:hypothetical protein A9266_19000 [Vibrio tasmaniensis]
MDFSVISEDFMRSPTAFQCVDTREFLYSTNNYQPTSSESPILWEDKNITSTMVHPIADNGDICVTKGFAELVMSFDPYGVEFYPASLSTKDGDITERYILALNNIQDVVDHERSVVEVSPNSGNLIIHRLFLSSEKISNIPFQKRVVYRAKGADTAVFFAPEIYDLLSNDSRFSLVRKMKKNTSMRAPKF